MTGNRLSGLMMKKGGGGGRQNISRWVQAVAYIGTLFPLLSEVKMQQAWSASSYTQAINNYTHTLILATS